MLETKMWTIGTFNESLVLFGAITLIETLQLALSLIYSKETIKIWPYTLSLANHTVAKPPSPAWEKSHIDHYPNMSRSVAKGGSRQVHTGPDPLSVRSQCICYLSYQMSVTSNEVFNEEFGFWIFVCERSGSGWLSQEWQSHETELSKFAFLIAESAPPPIVSPSTTFYYRHLYSAKNNALKPWGKVPECFNLISPILTFHNKLAGIYSHAPPLGFRSIDRESWPLNCNINYIHTH